jgi:hypothetical protein
MGRGTNEYTRARLRVVIDFETVGVAEPEHELRDPHDGGNRLTLARD